MTVTVIPLAPGVALPQPAPARTRSPIPPGYGVQEQCLPFTAASALGFLIPSPIDFGLCPQAEAPPGSRAFRSPIPPASPDDRVFYVIDRPECRFAGNAWTPDPVPESAPSAPSPGLSFFDRQDQQDLFKLHLPYIWRTPEAIDTLFLPLLNRLSTLTVMSGLVETDWYGSSVNMILRKPEGSVHVRAGDPIAQAILIARQHRRPDLEVAAGHSRVARETRKDLAEWRKQHAENRSAYKIQARSRDGRLDS